MMGQNSNTQSHILWYVTKTCMFAKDPRCPCKINFLQASGIPPIVNKFVHRSMLKTIISNPFSVWKSKNKLNMLLIFYIEDNVLHRVRRISRKSYNY